MREKEKLLITSNFSFSHSIFLPFGDLFPGSVLGQDTSEPQPSTGEAQEDMNNVSCRPDMTEILLKAA